MPASDNQQTPPENSAGRDPESLSVYPGATDGVEENDDWSGEDLERAYQEALSTIDDLERELPSPLGLFSSDAEEEGGDEENAVQSFNDFPGSVPEMPPLETESTASSEALQPLPRIQPAKIIEAALFVGGMALTVKRLAAVLRDEFDRDFIEHAIDELNLRYDAENRPYEIRLEEGGYRMVLRPEFESVRNKSYGFGPKEVRLSQEALEVLALVAYRQPISGANIEQISKSNPNGVLRQLLRREIIGLKRTGKAAKDVTYHTTPRFLQIFGLADLSELPHGEDLSFK
jgi:segregation and condensation protein B